MFKTRRPPIAVMRQLRQEVGFGCAQCGSPILEYHHIIEWAESQHHDPEHMVALCPTHHREIGKRQRKHAYRIKKNPINIRTKRFRGYLGGNSNKKALQVGSIYVEECEKAISYSGNDIFSYSFADGETLLNVWIPDQQFWPEMEIKENNVSAWIDDFWDIEFKTNWVSFQKKKGEVFLTIDFRGDVIKVESLLEIMGEKFELRSKGFKAGSVLIERVHSSGGKCAVRIGPKGRIIPPNLAMREPKAFLMPPS